MPALAELTGRGQRLRAVQASIVHPTPEPDPTHSLVAASLSIRCEQQMVEQWELTYCLARFIGAVNTSEKAFNA